MGKRKYSGNKDESPKKPKRDEASDEPEKEDENREQKENVTAEENGPKTHPNRHGFDVKHFRKELAAKQGQTMVLTQFLQVCLNPDSEKDYLLEYLKSGGNSHEILRQISTENKKNLTLATPAFHIFHLIILKVQASMPHMISVTEEACRYFLNTFMSTVEIMISENSGPRHRKIILKLLTSMVTLNPDLGVEVLNQAPLTPKHLQYIMEKTNYKEKENVRTSFVHFMTSFLVDGHLPLIKALLEKQGLIALVIPGLGQDEAEAVLMFLNILKKNVVDNSFISKSLKLKTFSHQVLHNIFKVFSWKGPPEISNEARNNAKPDIMNLISDILLTLFTSHRLGLYFNDPSLGTADANKNQNLYKALLTLKRPWENEYECETILQILFKCPDLHRAIINVIEQSFEPQHSPIWERATQFIIKLLDKLKPEEMVPRMKNLTSTQTANFIRFITLPVPLLKFINLSLGKDQTVSLYCIKVLVKMLQTLRRYMQLLTIDDNQHIVDLKNRLEYFVPKHLPTPSAVVALIKDVMNGKTTEAPQDYKLPEIKNTDALISLIDLLLLYNDVHPAFFETLEGNIDMKKLLDFSTNLTEGSTSVLKFKVVSLWLALDNSAISLKNPIFKDLFLIMLEVYSDDHEDKTWMEAKDTLFKFFKNTQIFEADENEIHLLLFALLNSLQQTPPAIIVDIVEYVLENITELTDFVRTQITHFKTTDESSEKNLNKLFDDLTENRTVTESIFLESRMPSPFIAGCMQYIQKHKDKKKKIEDFLTLYVANLLHSNCSPEFVEVLIGDAKLEVRKYVASCASEPTYFPANHNDATLHMYHFSKAILSEENFDMENIFPQLKKVVNDEFDFTLGGVNYKIEVQSSTNSTDLLIWANYLNFILVILTKNKQLTEKQAETILDFLECIKQIGRKHHMKDVCRTIISTLFKNTHVLKVFTAIDVGKHKSNVLSTKSLLYTITRNEDIVGYLDKKFKLLKPYQQKTYTELAKLFAKLKKNKDINSEHTIKVLEVIGMSKEDDLHILNDIFNLEINTLVKDDKEPSVVLDVLRILIEKYAKSISLEPQPGVLKKTMKLYTDLLTNAEMTPNLTDLENTLCLLLENKPHHIGAITDDIFKKFFNVNTVRKTTSKLAFTILKLNVKLCTIYKDQISKPEILAQRELALPLGNAILNHIQFLSDNSQILTTLYSEYKSNIIKFLEKPHKAGQIYITCWELVWKLILECMEINECEKIFAKAHKFEMFELCHVHLMQAAFLKMHIVGQVPKKDHFINYLLTMLNLVSISLKEAKEVEAVNEAVSNIYEIVLLNKEPETGKQEDFKKLTESAIWQNFCKHVLKDSLKVKTAEQSRACGPKLLFLLSKLVSLCYPVDHEDTATLFDMVTSHSEFLNVMLSHHSSDIKSRLVEFIYVLIMKNKSLMKTQQIPVYLSAYHATRSPCDRMLLSILHYYENNGLPVNDYKPYVFGDSAANHYAVRKNRMSSLWAHPTPNQVMNLFEKDVIEKTVRNFPVTQKLEYDYELPVEESKEFVFRRMMKDGLFKTRPVKDNEGRVKKVLLKLKYGKDLSDLKSEDIMNVCHTDCVEDVYDPGFVFPVLSHVLAPGSVASCFKLARGGLLALPLAALGSLCPRMRAAAYHVLHRFCLLLETETRHKNDKLFLSDFVNTLRQSLATAIVANEESPDNLRNPRLPAVDALYLGRALLVSTVPSDPLYKPVNNFFIAKQIVDLTVVPDFLSLFHDSDVEAAERRAWILDIIKNGTKTMTDVNVLFKTMCLKMMMDFSGSVLSDRKINEKIVAVLSAIVSIPRACEILIEGYGLISWLHSFVRQLKKEDKISTKSVLNLIDNILKSLTINAFHKNLNVSVRNGKPIEFTDLKVNKEIESEILVILYDLLNQIDNLDDEEMTSYVKTYKSLSKKVIKSLNRKQMLNLVDKIGENNKDSEEVKLLKKAVVKSDASILKSNSLLSTYGLLDDLSTVIKVYLCN